MILLQSLAAPGNNLCMGPQPKLVKVLVLGQLFTLSSRHHVTVLSWLLGASVTDPADSCVM